MGAPDKNFLSYAAGTVGTLDLSGKLMPPASFVPWADTLKFSAATDADIKADFILGGYEDCMDANNGASRLKVYVKKWYSGGGQVCTLKGGLDDIELGGSIEVHGKNTDIELDNYSDQNHSPCKNVRLNFTTADGSPVHYKTWMGVRPTIMNPEQKYVCDLYLPYLVGIVWNRFYQLLKIFGVP